MARDENPPMRRGETYPLGNGDECQYVGKEYVFEDLDPSASGGANVVKSGRPVVCRFLRNVSAGALLGKRLGKLTSGAAGEYGAQVTGYGTVTNDVVIPIDEYLPAAGVPQYYGFWGVVEGPCTVLTDLAGGANNLIPVGTELVALTAATSGATTSGRVAPYAIDNGTTANSTNADAIKNRIGYALSARTTGNTNADLRMHAYKRW